MHIMETFIDLGERSAVCDILVDFKLLVEIVCVHQR